MVRSAYSPAARAQVSKHVPKPRKAGMPLDPAVVPALGSASRRGKKVPSPKVSKAPKAATSRPTKARKAPRKTAKRVAGARKTKPAAKRAKAKTRTR